MVGSQLWCTFKYLQYTRKGIHSSQLTLSQLVTVFTFVWFMQHLRTAMQHLCVMMLDPQFTCWISCWGDFTHTPSTEQFAQHVQVNTFFHLYGWRFWLRCIMKNSNVSYSAKRQGHRGTNYELARPQWMNANWEGLPQTYMYLTYVRELSGDKSYAMAASQWLTWKQLHNRLSSPTSLPTCLVVTTIQRAFIPILLIVHIFISDHSNAAYMNNTRAKLCIWIWKAHRASMPRFCCLQSWLTWM